MIKEIQYLRAIAVIYVLAAHSGFVGPLIGWHPYFNNMAQAGVDIFFVISGFVVSGSLFRNLELGRNLKFLEALEANVSNLKAFFVKRIFRLFPVVLLVVVADVVCANLTGWPNIATIEEVMTLLSHISLQNDFDSFVMTQTGQIRFLGHFWSLAVEERFYLITPFVIIACITWRRFMMVAFATIVGLSVLKSLYPFPEYVMYLSGFLRLDSFMFGIIVYLLHTHTNILRYVFDETRNRLLMNLLSLLLLLIIARLPISQVVFTPDGKWTIRAFVGSAYYYVCIYTLSSILIAMAAQQKGYVLAIPGLQNILFWIGEKSYSIYVFQFFYLGLTKQIVDAMPEKLQVRGDNVVMTIVLIVVAGVGSEVVYRYWERPLRLYGRKIAERISDRGNPTLSPMA